MRRTENKVSVYLEDKELRIARELATANGLSMSSWIRSLILREARQTGVSIPPEIPEPSPRT